MTNGWLLHQKWRNTYLGRRNREVLLEIEKKKKKGKFKKKKKKGKLKTKKLSKITIDRTKAEEIEEICIHQNLDTGHHSNNI